MLLCQSGDNRGGDFRQKQMFEFQQTGHNAHNIKHSPQSTHKQQKSPGTKMMEVHSRFEELSIIGGVKGQLADA